MELSKGEYVLATVTSTKKDIFGNWTECHMGGDYCLVNKRTRSDKYAMPYQRRSLMPLGQTKVFSTLDLRFGYHQLPLREGDKVKITFWGIDPHGKDCLYQWEFLPFGLKNAFAKFQRVMDQVLVGLDFAKCYIIDIIVFSLTLGNHLHHLQELFEKLKEHNLKLHPCKC